MGLKILVKSAETKQQDVRNMTVGRFKFNVFLSHGTDNTDIVPTDIDFTKLMLRANLKRNNKTIEVFNGAVSFAVLASHLDNNLNYVHPLNTTAANMQILRAKGAAVKEQAQVTAVIDLPGVINLKEADILSLECQLASGAFASDIDSAVSYVELEIEDFVGIETAIPYIKIWPINANEISFTPPLGDDIVKLCYVNTDKDSILEADSPFTTLNLSSDKGTWNYDFKGLLGRRYYDITAPTDAAYLRHSHIIYSGIELDNVALSMQMVSANLNSGKNAVVAFHLNADAETFQRAVETTIKHQQRNVEKIVKKAPENLKNAIRNKFSK